LNQKWLKKDQFEPKKNEKDQLVLYWLKFIESNY